MSDKDIIHRCQIHRYIYMKTLVTDSLHLFIIYHQINTEHVSITVAHNLQMYNESMDR